MITEESKIVRKRALVWAPVEAILPEGFAVATDDELRTIGYTRSNAMAGLWDGVAGLIGMIPGETYDSLAQRTYSLLGLCVQMKSKLNMGSK